MNNVRKHIEYDTGNKFENKIHYFDVFVGQRDEVNFLEDLNRLPIVHMKLF